MQMEVKDIPQRITVILGEKYLTLDEIKQAGEGSILQLNALANQDLEIRANDIPIAVGELLTVGDNFGIRITRNLTLDEQRKRMFQGKRVLLTEVKKA